MDLLRMYYYYYQLLKQLCELGVAVDIYFLDRSSSVLYYSSFSIMYST